MVHPIKKTLADQSQMNFFFIFQNQSGENEKRMETSEHKSEAWLLFFAESFMCTFVPFLFLSIQRRMCRSQGQINKNQLEDFFLLCFCFRLRAKIRKKNPILYRWSLFMTKIIFLFRFLMWFMFTISSFGVLLLNYC